MKIIMMIITGIISSMYLFHFNFVGIQGFNTKRMLAVAGTLIFLFELGRKKKELITQQVITLTLFAFIVSIIACISTTYNNVHDTTYTSYFLSMWVWLLSSYTMIKMMSFTHGKVSVPIICNYFICVSIFQCIIAMMIAYIPEVKGVVDSIFDLDQEFLDNAVGLKRRYGIGASVDVAGTRFSAVLILLAIMLKNVSKSEYEGWVPTYVVGFFIIAIIGNIISRTTTVGMMLAIVYGVMQMPYLNLSESYTQKRILSWTVVTTCVMLIGTLVIVNRNPEFKKDIRFGFEGIFSLVESGEWRVASNDKLEKMYVWPDNAKTWIIGDGYFENPRHTDPYFTRKLTGGYYMGTDAGYNRFIFYFGVIGLLAFMAYFWKATGICASYFKKYYFMFYMLLLLNYVIWIKVATDIFIVYAPFLVLGALRSNNVDECEITDEIAEEKK